MTLRPLFFLPRSALRWAYEQVYAEKLMKHWMVRAIFCSVDSLGIEFPYKGDTIIWLWPWKRKGDLRPFISVLMSGTGEWGDAKYRSLAELDYFNKMMDEAVQPLVDQIQEEIDRKCVETFLTAIASDPLNAGDLVALDDFSNMTVKHVEHEPSLPICRVLINPTTEGSNGSIQLGK